MLGVAFLNGYGVEKDHAKALDWLNKAAEQSNADAQINLA
ncbi:hypothetical protein [Rudaea sp.]